MALILTTGACVSPTSTHGRGGRERPTRDVLSVVLLGDGRSVALRDLAGAKGTAIFFTGTYCPVALAYEQELTELRASLEKHGVSLVVVNSSYDEAPATIREHEKRAKLPFSIFKDAGGRLADAVGATRTSETALLDAAGNIVYRGRIDDRIEVGGVRRRQATKQDLLEAAFALALGRAVVPTFTKASGCVISRPPQPHPSRLTYAKDIAPILERRCVECHRPGEIGPMSLGTYEEARAWSETIREVIEDRRMPPGALGAPDPRHGEWIDTGDLTASERGVLLEWIRDGAPGAPHSEPTPPGAAPLRARSAGAWLTGEPDLVIGMKEPYAVPAKAPPTGLPWQRFTVYEHTGEDRWVTGVEIRSSERTVVHHAVVYLAYPEHPERVSDQMWAIFTPGNPRHVFRDGLARALPKGAKLTLEMHYTPDGVARSDQTIVGIHFAKTPPRYETRNIRLTSTKIDIPPGATDYEVVATFPMKTDGWLAGFLPHMHMRGKDMRYEAVLPDGTVRTLLFVPRFDYQWQLEYVPKEMIRLPRGTVIRTIGRFDNSRANPRNPDPTARVLWGEQTSDEMMCGFAELVYDEPIGSPKLREYREAEREEAHLYQGFESRQAMVDWMRFARQRAAERRDP